MTMQALTVALKEPPTEPAGAIRSTSPASEKICAFCGGTGWRPAGGEDLRYRRCECVRARVIAVGGRTLCHVCTARELIEEFRKAELDDKFVSPVMIAAYASAPYHLFWDDIDKLKPSDFKTEVLFELVASERLHSAIVRRLDDMCKVIEI